MKRRDFIRRSSAAAAGAIIVPSIIPGSALGKNGMLPPSDRIVMAAIGMGGMGKGNMNALLKTGDTQFVAVCDLDEERRSSAQGALHKYYDNKDAKAYEDYEKMLRKHDVDAVTIAVPDHWHALLYVDCAKRGLHIYGEKPLVRSLEEGKKVVKAVKDSGIVWQTGSWQRSVKQFGQACELVANGALGEIERIEVGLPDLDRKVGMPPVEKPPKTIDYNWWVGPAPYSDYRGTLHFHWRWIQKYSAGQLTDWGAHHIDIALWSMGLDRTGPSEIKGTGKFNVGDYYDVPYEFEIDYVLKGGLPMKVMNRSLAPEGQGVTWYNAKGEWIHVDRKKLVASDEKLLSFETPANGKKFIQPVEHRKNFTNCVRSGELPVAHIEAAHRANSCSLLGEIAILTGETIKWDDNSELLVGASGKAKALTDRNYRKPYSF